MTHGKIPGIFVSASKAKPKETTPHQYDEEGLELLMEQFAELLFDHWLDGLQKRKYEKTCGRILQG